MESVHESQPGIVLRDRFGRGIDYLRLSVTDRCDLRCRYCRPVPAREELSEPAHWLRFDEIVDIVGAFAGLGVRRVRLTGGEPLLRRGVCELAARLRAIPGVEDLSLSTNATQLARHAAALRAAGVARLNVSLDSLRAERVRGITCRDALPKVLEGLKAAKETGFDPIKINMVVMAGVNDDEIEAMIEFCAGQGFILRLIEAMPVGEAGARAPYADLHPIRARLTRRYALMPGVVRGAGPARYLRSPDNRIRVGFITAMSQHFCATCNRVRLDVEGSLHTCLGAEHCSPLRQLVRAGADRVAIQGAIRRAIAAKPERHAFNEARTVLLRSMAKTGG